MDPLSAMKMAGLPDLGSQFNASGLGAAVPSKISIPDLQQLPQPIETGAPGTVAPSEGSSFSNVLSSFVQDVNDKQAAAGESVSGLLGGKNVSLHQTMISVEEASVSFQLMVEVRNRLLDSYQELMRMQV